MICDAKLLKVLVNIVDKLPNLKYVVTMGDDLDAKLLEKLKASGSVMVTSVSSCMAKGAELIAGKPDDYFTPAPEDLAVIMYTSGIGGFTFESVFMISSCNHYFRLFSITS